MRRILSALAILDMTAYEHITPRRIASAVMLAVALIILAVILAGCDARTTPTPRPHNLTVCPSKENCLDQPRPTAGELNFTR